MSKSNTGLLELNNKIKNEINIVKNELKRKQVQIDELETRIRLTADADRQISELRNSNSEKDKLIQMLRGQLEEAFSK